MNHNISLEALIAEKDFDQLSPFEKEFVLNCIPQEEYEFQRVIILESQELFSKEDFEMTPDPSVLEVTMKQVKPEQSFSIFQHRIKTWQAAAILLIGLLIIPFQWNSSASPTEKIVYVDRIIPTEKKPTIRVHLVANLKKERQEGPAYAPPANTIQSVPNVAFNGSAEAEHYPLEMYALNSIDLDQEISKIQESGAYSMVNDSIGKSIETMD